MSEPRVRDVVGWHVDRTPAPVLAGRVVAGIPLLALAVVGNSSGPVELFARRSARVPTGDDDLGEPLQVSGAAPWMPSAALGPQDVRLTARAAAINPVGLPGRDLNLPLHSLRPVGARSRRRRRSRHESAEWVLTAEGEAAQVEFRGAWIALCWLGHLAGWAEPRPD